MQFKHLASILGMLFAPTLYAASLNWNTSTGSWNVPGNWSPTQIPTSADNATIGNGGTAQLIAAPNGSVDRLVIGSGNLDVQNVQLNIIIGPLNVGFSGTAALTISSGGVVQQTSCRLAHFAGDVGAVTVTGPGSTLLMSNIFLSEAGSGTLTVDNGGQATCLSGINFTNNAGCTGTLNLNSTAGQRGRATIGGLTAGPGTHTANFNGGILQASQPNSTFITGFTGTQLNIQAGGLFIDSNTFNIGTNNPLTGVGPLTKMGAGTLTLSGTNTYGGGTTVSDSGTLSISTAASLPTGTNVTLSSSGSTLDLSPAAGPFTIGDLSGVVGSNLFLGTSSVTCGTATPTVTFAGLIAGSGSLTKTGAGTLSIPNANSSWSGSVFLQNGTLNVGNSQSLGTTGAVVTFQSNPGNVLQMNGSIFPLIQLDFITNGVVDTQGFNATVPSIIGSASMTKIGMGSLTIHDPSGSYSGQVLLNQGTLIINDSSSLGTGSLTFQNIDGNIFQAGNPNLAISNQVTFTKNGVIDTQGFTFTMNGNLLGAGTLTKQGAGTLIIGGTNSYTATKTVTNGILQGTTNSLKGNINLQNNSTVIFNQGFIGPYLGSIGGAGSLVIDGGGTVALNSSNSYSGGTTINNGTLSIDADSKLGSITGPIIFNGGTLTWIANGSSARTITLNAAGGTINTGVHTVTLSGPIGGTGSLTFTGGVLNLTTSANTYSGGTIINGGILLVDSDARLGNVSGGITFNAGELQWIMPASSSRTITLNGGGAIDTQANTVTLSGGILGAGSLTKNGSGLLILTGTNNYSGGTTVSTGTLQGNANSLQGAITNNDTVIFDQAGIGTYAGAMSGSGTLTKQNIGTLILSGANSYTGGTTVSAGVLQGDTTSLQGKIVDNDSLVFDQTTTGTYAGSISGTGSVTKQNTGTVILSGTSTYTGPTSVNGGTLVNNGTLASLVTVASGATLKGTGTIGSSLNVFGTVRPGNSVGTLTVAGPVTFNSGSTYVEELDPTQASLLNVTGGGVNINPGVTLSILPNPGAYAPGSTYTIIHTAGGVVAGTFSTVTDSMPLLVFSVNYTPNSVVLNLAKKPGGFSNLVPSGNAGAVAKCLDNAHPTSGSDFDNVLNQLLSVTTAETLEHDLNQLQPSQLNALQLSQENNNTRVLSVLTLRTSQLHRPCKPQKQTWGVWVDTYGDALEQQHQHGEHGFRALTGSALVGVDGHATPSLYLGFGGAYTWTSLKWGGTHGKGDISSGYGFAYGTWNSRHFFLDGSFIGGCNSYEADRHIGFLVVDRDAKSNHHGYTLAGRLTGGVPFKAWKAEVTPLVSVDYDFLHQSAFKEHGAQSLNLHVDRKNANLLRGEIGFRIARRCPDQCRIVEKIVEEKIKKTIRKRVETEQVCIPSEARWLPSFQLSVIREWRFQGERYKSRLEGLDCTFTTKGLNPDRTLISPAAGITYLVGDRINLTLDYVGEFDVGGNFWDQKVNLQINYAF